LERPSQTKPQTVCRVLVTCTRDASTAAPAGDAAWGAYDYIYQPSDTNPVLRYHLGRNALGSTLLGTHGKTGIHPPPKLRDADHWAGLHGASRKRLQ